MTTTDAMPPKELLLDRVGISLQRRDNTEMLNNVRDNIKGQGYTQTEVVSLTNAATAFRDCLPPTFTVKRFLQLCGII